MTTNCCNMQSVWLPITTSYYLSLDDSLTTVRSELIWIISLDMDTTCPKKMACILWTIIFLIYSSQCSLVEGGESPGSRVSCLVRAPRLSPGIISRSSSQYVQLNYELVRSSRMYWCTFLDYICMRSVKSFIDYTVQSAHYRNIKSLTLGTLFI